LAAGGDGECIVRAELELGRIPEIRTTFSAFNDRVLID